jgi:hypothetical protein
VTGKTVGVEHILTYHEERPRPIGASRIAMPLAVDIACLMPQQRKIQ